MARPVSAEFKSLLTKSRELVARVELLDRSRTPILTTDPSSTSPIKVTALRVSVDATREVRGEASCTIAITDKTTSLVPSNPGGVLSPASGATFRVWAGFRLPSTGMVEFVPCGRYDVDRCLVRDTPAGLFIDLAGDDLTGRLNAADIDTAFSILWGTNKLTAAQDMVRAVIPDMEFSVVPSNQQTAWIVIDEQANRLSEIKKIMTSMGYEAFMDPDGERMHMEPIATTQDVAAWVYDAASMKTVGEVQNSLDRDRVYNGVIVHGENLSSDVAPVRSAVWNTNPADPTFYDPGPPVRTNIGPRPYFMVSQYITTQEQADGAAIAQLVRVQGLLQQVTMRVGINPALNVGDVLEAYRPGAGVVGRYVTQSVEFDLVNPDVMTVVCQERRVTG